MITRFYLPVIAFLYLSILPLSVSAFEKMVEQAKFEYDVMAVEALKPVKQLDTLYLDNLEALKKTETQRGALDSVLAITKVEEAIRNGKKIPGVDQSHSELHRLHSIYLENREKRMTAAKPTLDHLKSRYISKLEEYVIVLTRNEQIDEAVRLRKFIEQEKAIDPGKSDKEPKTQGDGERVFNLVTGEFCGTIFGDMEEDVRKKMEAAGLPIKGESKVGEGKNISQPLGINFRIDKRGRYYQNYILGERVPLPGGLQLRKSTVEDFEKVLDKRAREQDRGKYLIKMKDCELLLITDSPDDSVVFSIMITER
ncbi:MAG: hypothetical protein P1V20_18420 [Verrucomicrobiales bacterium]|nr:hypothetical protein [Verrucomicrobiales bacterium]